MKIIAPIAGICSLIVVTPVAASFADRQEPGAIEDRLDDASAQLLETSASAPSNGSGGAAGLVNISLQPSEIDQRLPDDRSPQTDPAETLTMPPPPALREGPEALFVLTAVEISGVTAFPMERFAPLYDNMLARAITVDDINRLVESITSDYRDEGYFLSRATAPQQSGAGGVLRIDVAEGYIESVSVKGDSTPAIKKQIRQITGKRPLKLSALEGMLARLGDLKGVSVASSRIEPDPIDFARHHFVVEIEQDRIEASLYIDNRGTDAAGPVQAYARAAANSVLRTGDQFSVGLYTIPDNPSELALAEASYHLPLSPTGTYATFSGMYSKFDAGADLATFDTQSRTKRLSFSLSHPLIRTRKTSLWANVGIEARDIEEEQLGAPTFNDKLRVVSAWANFRKNHWNGYTTAYGKLSQGLNMLGATIDANSLSRPDANGEFTKFTAQLSRYQNIGKTFGLYLAFSGQTANDPLLASEEFSLGGARFGRAYDYGELTGDDGVATVVELRYGRNPDIDVLDFFQLYGFYDYGVVWNDNAAPEFQELSLSSAGAGLRLTFPASLSANFEIAKPLDRTPFTQDDRDWRGFFSVSKSF